jgi:hypothetical protein
MMKFFKKNHEEIEKKGQVITPIWPITLRP